MADYLNLTTNSSGDSTFLSNAHEVIVNYYNKAENASTTDDLAKLEFSRVDVSETMVFDALTIEIPLQKIGFQDDNSSSSNPFYQTMYGFLCNREVCLMPNLQEYTGSGATTTIYPRVQALAICLNDAGNEDLTVDFTYYRADEVMQSCKQRSTTSMVVVSIGKRIEVEDLASVYGANCASADGCDGIRFPLEKSDNASTGDMLLVSDTGIPTSLLSPINMNINWFSVGTTQWTILASTMEETRGAALPTETRPALMVLPRNFETANTTLTEYMNESGWSSCEMFIDRHIHQVEKNPVY
ncbi:hypothetical protein Pcac1_g20687 [Phytophthora cactorum]|uniref:Uncharacterized protein n=1 Tax=Phytophthora cactorum TaxID=29920 RepID=A0A8T0ZRH8_9STRA|nr:hypothetical protein Pcac1_g20687 [Phytophthora cactorum]KAG2838069.1 hypothetical protein PC112_g4666 [Phytophthora cactorum]KAG2840307.1 hypothetical protein PC111_g3524 [Phytophthora cactorum]KAG2864572.1 hypothetical protein PC113_g4463 [Phytophthora cactorum]KAG2937597.1 hypothetical protein PC115_g4119 [Phytophthora cactorum]